MKPRGSSERVGEPFWRVQRGVWFPLSSRPDYMEQPSRQFIRIEGERTHHGDTWNRIICGTAFIDRDTLHGYRQSDIDRLLADGDMDPFMYFVTHWMAEIYPTIPPEQRTSQETEHV